MRRVASCVTISKLVQAGGNDEPGSAAVRGSLEAMKAQLETGALARAASRAVLRMMNRVPSLKRWFFLAKAAE